MFRIRYSILLFILVWLKSIFFLLPFLSLRLTTTTTTTNNKPMLVCVCLDYWTLQYEPSNTNYHHHHHRPSSMFTTEIIPIKTKNLRSSYMKIVSCCDLSCLLRLHQIHYFWCCFANFGFGFPISFGMVSLWQTHANATRSKHFFITLSVNPWQHWIHEQ